MALVCSQILIIYFLMILAPRDLCERTPHSPDFLKSKIGGAVAQKDDRTTVTLAPLMLLWRLVMRRSRQMRLDGLYRNRFMSSVAMPASACRCISCEIDRSAVYLLQCADAPIKLIDL
jgi:hypothetical protein